MSDMSAEREERPRNEGAEQDARSEGDEGRRAADASPPIADDARDEQTHSPAPPGDVGVPPDEEIAEEEAAREDR